MKGSIKCSWYYGKKIIFYKMLFQGLIVVVGIALNVVFNKIIDNEICAKINEMIYVLILMFSIDVYMQLYDKQQKTKVDKYLAATPLGFKKYNDGLLLFDGLFFIYSFCIGLGYMLLTSIIAVDKSNTITWKYLVDIVFAYGAVKMLLVITMNILRDTKSTIISLLIFAFIISNNLWDRVNVQDLKLSSMNIYYIVLIILILVYIFLRSMFEKLWKRKS